MGFSLELEWRIPWPVEWDVEKKIKAGNKLVEYINDGTMFDVERRIAATATLQYAESLEGRPLETTSPYIKLTLER